jgi:hypothetical protein
MAPEPVPGSARALVIRPTQCRPDVQIRPIKYRRDSPGPDFPARASRPFRPGDPLHAASRAVAVLFLSPRLSASEPRSALPLNVSGVRHDDRQECRSSFGCSCHSSGTQHSVSRRLTAVWQIGRNRFPIVRVSDETAAARFRDLRAKGSWLRAHRGASIARGSRFGKPSRTRALPQRGETRRSSHQACKISAVSMGSSPWSVRYSCAISPKTAVSSVMAASLAGIGA